MFMSLCLWHKTHTQKTLGRDQTNANSDLVRADFRQSKVQPAPRAKPKIQTTKAELRRQPAKATVQKMEILQVQKSKYRAKTYKRQETKQAEAQTTICQTHAIWLVYILNANE